GGHPSAVSGRGSAAVVGKWVVWLLPPLTTGAVFARLTVMVTSADADSAVSLAVNLRTYVPAWSKLAVVVGLAAFANVTVPGPLKIGRAPGTDGPEGGVASVTWQMRA